MRLCFFAVSSTWHLVERLCCVPESSCKQWSPKAEAMKTTPASPRTSELATGCKNVPRNSDFYAKRQGTPWRILQPQWQIKRRLQPSHCNNRESHLPFAKHPRTTQKSGSRRLKECQPTTTETRECSLTEWDLRRSTFLKTFTKVIVQLPNESWGLSERKWHITFSQQPWHQRWKESLLSYAHHRSKTFCRNRTEPAEDRRGVSFWRHQASRMR